MVKEILFMEELLSTTLVSEDMEIFQANKVALASVSTTFRDMFQTIEETNEFEGIYVNVKKSIFRKAMVDIFFFFEKLKFYKASVVSL